LADSPFNKAASNNLLDAGRETTPLLDLWFGNLIYFGGKKMKKITLTIMLAAVTVICLAGCSNAPKMSDKFPGTKDGAKALLQEFMKPGADNKKLTMELQPSKEDYRAFFKDQAIADRAAEQYDKMWSSGNAVVAPKAGQTELRLFSATTEELSNYQGESGEFPGGLIGSSAGEYLKPNLTIYAFKFVEPGEKLGMAYEGLTHINGHWRLFPKPWQFAKEK
jgi:hypothetical protein